MNSDKNTVITVERMVHNTVSSASVVCSAHRGEKKSLRNRSRYLGGGVIVGEVDW